MVNRFISSLPAFTLESLVASGRWAAAQSSHMKKGAIKSATGNKKADQPGQAPNRTKPA